MASALFMLTIISCATPKSVAPEKVNSLLQSGEFTFMAERANPSGNDINNVLNSFPNASSANILNLQRGYTIVLKQDIVSVDLPYFGRMYTPSFDRSKDSFKFTDAKYQITKSKGKKESEIFKIAPEEQSNVRQIIMEVYPNGKAYVSINANDRQTISYDGYIVENSVVKK